MARAKADVTDTFKRWVLFTSFSTISLVLLAIVLFGYDWQAERFTLRFIELLWLALVGITLSSIIYVFITWPKGTAAAKPKAIGFQGDGKPGIQLPKVFHNGEPVNVFEQSMPAGFSGGYAPQQGSITRSLMDSLRGIRIEAPPRTYQAPSRDDREYFWMNGIQIPGKAFYKFLKYAEGNRPYGRGLSARRWRDGVPNNRHRRPGDWWNPVWYDPAMSLLDHCSKATNVQLVILLPNNWLILARSAGYTYMTVCQVMYPQGWIGQGGQNDGKLQRPN